MLAQLGAALATEATSEAPVAAPAVDPRFRDGDDEVHGDDDSDGADPADAPTGEGSPPAKKRRRRRRKPGGAAAGGEPGPV